MLFNGDPHMEIKQTKNTARTCPSSHTKRDIRRTTHYGGSRIASVPTFRPEDAGFRMIRRIEMNKRRKWKHQMTRDFVGVN